METQNNKETESVIEDLKNAFKQDVGSSFNMPNPLDIKGRIDYMTDNPEKPGEPYIRRHDDFSVNLSTKTMLKILIPLVVLFVVGFLVYTFFFYTI